MKNVLFGIVVFIAFAASYAGVVFTVKSRDNGIVKSVFTAEPYVAAQTPTPYPSSIPEKPVSLSIPSINITASIEEVGLDSEKRMDVPKDDMGVGWYMFGPRPGETGNAVLAGHFDTPTGNPAIFFKLNALVPGDEIIVTDQKGNRFTFEVTRTETAEDATFPISTVFGETTDTNLNLITCAGVFDNIDKNYQDRFIAYSKLKE